MANDDLINVKISDEKLKIARQKDFIYNQINKLTKKIYSNLCNINVRYYLKLPIPIMHRQFHRKNLKIRIM